MKTADCIVFGKSVRRERMALGLTIEQLAELVGMSERQIQNIEKGKSNPKLSTIVAIARALNCVLTIHADGSLTLSRAEQKLPDGRNPIQLLCLPTVFIPPTGSGRRMLFRGEGVPPEMKTAVFCIRFRIFQINPSTS